MYNKEYSDLHLAMANESEVENMSDTTVTSFFAMVRESHQLGISDPSRLRTSGLKRNLYKPFPN